MADTDKENAANSKELWLWRAYSIGAYSNMEQVLCHLLQSLLGTTGNKAAVIFFKITNSRARNDIIEKLIKDVYGNNFNIFWNSFFRQMNGIDGKRNEIVHWTTLYEHTNSGPRAVRLSHPNFWARTEGSHALEVKDLQEFTLKTQTFGALVGKFISFVCFQHENLDKDEVDAWLNIFHEPLVYPLPSDHLLYKIPLVHEIQQPPFDL